jgi:hypothetical protein
MADYYTQTSFAIEVTAAEAALIQEIDPLLRAIADGFETAAQAAAVYEATSLQFQAAFPKGADGDPFFELTRLFDDPTWPATVVIWKCRRSPSGPDTITFGFMAMMHGPLILPLCSRVSAPLHCRSALAGPTPAHAIGSMPLVAAIWRWPLAASLDLSILMIPLKTSALC